MSATSQRIASLDFVRGIAILGILLMNIHAMALPWAAYANPDYDGVATLADKLVFSFEYVFINTKFFALFSLLFGIGLLLLGQKLDEANRDSHRWLRRRLWFLALIGALHGVFIWPGDILLTYALCGLLLQPQRYHAPRSLLLRGGGMIAIGLGLLSLWWFAVETLLPGSIVRELSQGFTMPPELLEEDRALWIGGNYFAHIGEHLGIWLGYLLFVFPLFAFWWCGGLMLVGMALFKSGWFDRERVPPETWRLGGLGLVAGSLGLLQYTLTDFGDMAAAHSPLLPLSGCLLGVFYLNVLIVVAPRFGALGRYVQMAGRTALSLYILQSLSMVLLFRWLAPELYGRMQELELLALVLAFSVLQVLLARFWLGRFGQGPLEKIWRRQSDRAGDVA